LKREKVREEVTPCSRCQGLFRQEGGISVGAVVLVAMMLLVGLFLFDVANIYLARSRARTAADAAAKAAGLELTPLFGVGDEPERAARVYAERHGCRLEEVLTGDDGHYQWVQVRVAKRIDSLFLPGKAGVVRASARCYLDLGALTAVERQTAE
jgi:hypothetical protein